MQLRHDLFFVMAGLYLTVGVLAVVGKLAVETGFVEPLSQFRWVMIHLVTIGAMTQVLFGALPHLVGSVGGSSTNFSPQLRWSQWISLNTAYPLILFGMTTGSTLVAVTGATIVLFALALLLVTVYRISADSCSSMLSRYYRVAPWFLVVGIFAAFGMLLNVHGPGGYFGSIEAHVHANVWGFLALVVAATLLHIVPALAGTELRYPRLKRVTFWGVTIGAVGLVSGPWLAIHVLTFTGLAVYVIGTIALLANIVGTKRASGCTKDARVGHILGAYVWLIFPVPWAPLVLLFPNVVPRAPIETAAINGLVFGWMLQLAMAFLPIVVGVFEDTEGVVDVTSAVESSSYAPSWMSVGSINLGMLALWATAFPVFSNIPEMLSVAGFALIALPWAVFVVRLWQTFIGDDPRTQREEPTDASAWFGD
jgi:cytochrome c oxidase cbb3-type subunit I